MRLAASAVLLGGVALSSSAAVIYVESPLVTNLTVNGTEFGSRYRLSQTNWDMSISRRNNTSSGTFFVQGQLGNVPALSTIDFDFQLQNIAGQGLFFRLTRVLTPSTVTTIAWGTFSPAITPAPAAISPTLVDPLDSSVDAPSVLDYNSIQLTAINRNPNGAVSLSNVSFTSLAVTASNGAFQAASLRSGSFIPPGSSGPATQRLVADTNLNTIDWTLTGRVTLAKTAIGGDESVRLDITGQNVSFTAIPEPTTLALLALGAGLLRRDRRQG